MVNDDLSALNTSGVEDARSNKNGENEAGVFKNGNVFGIPSGQNRTKKDNHNRRKGQRGDKHGRGTRRSQLHNNNQSQDQHSRLKISDEDRQTALNHITQLYESSLQPIRVLYTPNTNKKDNAQVDLFMANYVNRNHSHIITNPRLTDKVFRHQFHNQIHQLICQKAILFSIDIEAWEINNQTVTEIGISIYDPRRNGSFNLVPNFTKLHIRILENMHRVNGKYVVDHALNFVGEPTLILSMQDSVILIQSLFDYFFKSPNDDGLETYLVGHGLPGDIKWLSSIGINFPPKYATLDTLEILKITHGKHNLSLGNALRKLDLPHVFLHNAGNDAYYTLLLCLKLLDPGVRSLYQLDLCVDESLMMSEDERRALKEEKERKKKEKRELRELKKLQKELGLELTNEENDKDKSEGKKKKKPRKKQLQNHNIAQSVQCSASDAVLYVFGGKQLPEEGEGSGEGEEEVTEDLEIVFKA